MIDHVLGRPSVKFRKYQVFAVVTLWSLYLYKGGKHGPPVIKRLSEILSRRLTAWQILVVTLLWFYVGRNFAKVVGLESPEPLANLYSRDYFRATWVTTALDAGFWTAMRVKPKWLKDFLSMAFSIYYLAAAERADEKVRRVRGILTLEHLRVSWNKPETPYIKFITSLLRPRFMHCKPRKLRICRPKCSVYKDPVIAWLYFDGPLSELKKLDKLILDIPGGGFVAMNPRVHDDKLMAWAGKTGLPVLALDYRKAPEFPYPYALNECYDVYYMLIASHGTIVGLSGTRAPRIVVSGDSAGGNLAVGFILLLQTLLDDRRQWTHNYSKPLPLPESVILIYPALDFNIGNWMTDEQMALISERHCKKAYRAVLSQKTENYKRLTPGTSFSTMENLLDRDQDSAVTVIAAGATAQEVNQQFEEENTTAATDLDQPSLAPEIPKPTQLKTRLAMSSMISYFNDRMLTPEMMRAMIILYIGPHHRPDFSTDFLLSPILASDVLLADFPKTYIITGERDPLVDDTVIFAGRLREAHRTKHRRRVDLGLLTGRSREFHETDAVQVTLVPGISHGFLQFPGIFPAGWKYIYQCSDWMLETFDQSDYADDWDELVSEESPPGLVHSRSRSLTREEGHQPHHFRRRTDSSGDERPLEMTRVSPRGSQQSNGHSKRRSQPRRDRSQRRRSLVSLTSEVDLLGRRMIGLAGGLMGMEETDKAPPTP